MKIKLVIFAALCLFLVAMTSDSSATTQRTNLIWKIKSLHPYRVNLKFYSSSRNWFWPSADKYWILDDNQFHTFNLECNLGEKICYGAWSGDVYWGLGNDGRRGCKGCCFVCGQQPSPITLTSSEGDEELPKPKFSNNPDLAKLDAAMSDAYRRLRRNMNSEGADALLHAQREFLANRDRQTDKEALIKAYKEWLKVLKNIEVNRSVSQQFAGPDASRDIVEYHTREWRQLRRSQTEPDRQADKAPPKTNQEALNSAPADAVDQFSAGNLSIGQKLREFLGVVPDRQADEEAQAVQADEEAVAKAYNKAIEDFKKVLEQINKDVDVVSRPEPDTKKEQPRNPPRRHLDCGSLLERKTDLERRAEDRKARAQRHDQRRTALMARIREYEARGNAMSWKAPPSMIDSYNAQRDAIQAEQDAVNAEADLLNSEWDRLMYEARALDREWKECERLGVINGSPVKAKN